MGFPGRRVAAVVLFSLLFSACAAAPGATTSRGPTAAPRIIVRLNVGYGPQGLLARRVADYLSDGTVIRLNVATLESNRLNEAGLARLQETLATYADLLVTPIQIAPRSTVLPMDSTHNMPSGIVEQVNTFILERPDESRYTVSAPSRHSGDRFVADHDPVVERLTALADILADPATLLGPGSFAEPAWKTYQPAMTAVFLTLEETTPDNQVVNDGVIPHVGPTDWPFGADPHGFGTVYKGPGDHVTRRCAFLPSAEAATGLLGLSKAGGQRAPDAIAAGLSWHSPVLLWVAGSQVTFVSVQALALLPEDGAVSCSDALSY